MIAPTPATRAFTLVELLATIAIIGILSGLAFLGIGRALKSSRSASCLAHLRQLGLAAQQYAANNRGATPGYSWFYPYLEANAASRGTLAPYLDAPARWTDDRASALTCGEMQSWFPANANRPAKNTYTINGYTISLAENGTPLAATNAANQPRTRRLIDSVAPARQVFFFDGLPQNENASTGTWPYLSTGISTEVATYGRFVHDETANAVFLDGHCEKIPRSQFLAYSATSTFWLGR